MGHRSHSRPGPYPVLAHRPAAGNSRRASSSELSDARYLGGHLGVKPVTESGGIARCRWFRPRLEVGQVPLVAVPRIGRHRLRLWKSGADGYVAPGREGKQMATRDLKAHPATGRMVEKLATPAGRTAYAERKWLSEAPNGWIKHVLGFRRFSLRGLAKVRCEWDLVCLALNVKRLQPLMAA